MDNNVCYKNEYFEKLLESDEYIVQIMEINKITLQFI